MKKLYFNSLIFVIILGLCLCCTSCNTTKDENSQNKNSQNENLKDENKSDDNEINQGFGLTLSSYDTNIKMYLYIDSLDGNATVSTYDNWFELTEFKHLSGKELDNTDLDGTFVFTYEVNSATPRIQKYASENYIFRQIKLDVCKPNAGKLQVFYKVNIENAKILKAEVKTITDNNGSTKLVEEITLMCQKHTLEYTKYNADGTEGPSVQESFNNIY